LKALSSGPFTAVTVKAGDVVKRGKTLFAIDARDAMRAVRSAQTDLERPHSLILKNLNKLQTL
jgi:multidrug resistance efflux pump